MKMIVGLGNFDNKYSYTRHNAGAMLVEYLASSLGATLEKQKNEFVAAQVMLDRQNLSLIPGLSPPNSMQIELCLVRPQSYMNLSGRPITKALQHFQLKSTQLLVVHDEIDLDLGEIRHKQGGGHRGHNGLRDIIKHIGPNFDRLRFGVGRPEQREQVANYVLSPFSKTEKQSIDKYMLKASEMSLSWLVTNFANDNSS